MKAKEVWVIVPFSRPDWLENVKSNFLRQDFLNKKLVIIENGPAIGYCKKNNFKPDLLLTSDIAHQANAKNIGLNALIEKKVDFWTTFDDDDYYCSNYLSELVENSDKAEMIGKSTIFVKTKDDKFRLLKGEESSFTRNIHGPTISAWVKDTMLFPNTGQWGEDMAQITMMQEAGAKIWATSRYNFIFQRHENHNHTWHTTDDQLSQCWYKLQYGVDTSVIEYDVSISDSRKIAAKELSLPEGTLVPYREFTKEDTPCYTYLKEKYGDMDDWINIIKNKM
jgi:hypothetical protein